MGVQIRRCFHSQMPPESALCAVGPVSWRGVPQAGGAKRESDRVGAFDARSCSHDGLDPAEICRVAGGQLHQGQERHRIARTCGENRRNFVGRAFGHAGISSRRSAGDEDVIRNYAGGYLLRRIARHRSCYPAGSQFCPPDTVTEASISKLIIDFNPAHRGASISNGMLSAAENVYLDGTPRQSYVCGLPTQGGAPGGRLPRIICGAGLARFGPKARWLNPWVCRRRGTSRIFRIDRGAAVPTLRDRDARRIQACPYEQLYDRAFTEGVAASTNHGSALEKDPVSCALMSDL